ncbi:MAG: Ig-like domain-containing protein [Lachnospiraceae bacterium]|nr:Ig-like domain-containing protein [Lachnospiraceae bacterium]
MLCALTFTATPAQSLVAPVDAQAATKYDDVVKANLTVGYNADLTFKIGTKKIKNTKVTYKSNKPKVVSVSKKGVISAKKAGKATIIGTYNGHKCKYVITVKNDFGIPAGYSLDSRDIDNKGIGSYEYSNKTSGILVDIEEGNYSDEDFQKIVEYNNSGESTKAFSEESGIPESSVKVTAEAVDNGVDVNLVIVYADQNMNTETYKMIRNGDGFAYTISVSVDRDQKPDLDLEALAKKVEKNI